MFVFEGSTHSNIQITKGVNIHNNVQKIIFKEVLQQISNTFCHIKTFFYSKIKIISRIFIIGSSTINQLN